MNTLLWTDLETTGLDPNTRDILQVGMIVTTSKLTEVARFEELIKPPEHLLWDPPAKEMHETSGLFERACKDGLDLSVVAYLAREFILENTQADKLIMAGNTVHFDKGFLKVHMPKVLGVLHYRLLDVSFFKVLAQIWNLEKPEGVEPKEAPHTALADLGYSIESLRLWKRQIFRDGVGPQI